MAMSSSNKLLWGGLVVSATYLSYKLWDFSGWKCEDVKEERNKKILKDMNDLVQSGHLQNTPFPAHLELGMSRTPTRKLSLCESIQFQFQRDWNGLIYQLSRVFLK